MSAVRFAGFSGRSCLPATRRNFAVLLVSVLSIGAMMSRVAWARISDEQSLIGPDKSGFDLEPYLQPVSLTLIAFGVGSLIFSTVTMVVVRGRLDRVGLNETQMQMNLALAQAHRDRAEAVLAEQPGLTLIYENGDEVGRFGFLDGEVEAGADPIERGDPWNQLRVRVADDVGKQLDMNVDGLHRRGKTFEQVISLDGREDIWFRGFPVGSRTAISIRSLAGEQREFAVLQRRYDELVLTVDAVRKLLDALSAPAWIRDPNERLVWVNHAYAELAGQPQSRQLLESAEVFSGALRERSRVVRSQGRTFRERASFADGASQRHYEICDIASARGSAGIALDVTIEEKVQRVLDANRIRDDEVLKLLPQAVISFDQDTRLVSYNESFTRRWNISNEWLDGKPPLGTLLERMRTLDTLPRQANFRQWRDEFVNRVTHSENHAGEQWHLPDGKILQACWGKAGEVGFVIVFEDVTAMVQLETRLNTFAQSQRETINNLSEALAVFGSDGRIRLSNPEFSRLWLPLGVDTIEREHISSLLDRADDAWSGGQGGFEELRKGVAAVAERRQLREGKAVRRDGRIFRYRVVPLSDGAALAEFYDVTASENVERVLREKNLMLEASERHRDSFIENLSFELRNQLNNVVGYAEQWERVGAECSDEENRKFIKVIRSSSISLKALLDDVFDLATIRSGALLLDAKPLDLSEILENVQAALVARVDQMGAMLTVEAGATRGDVTVGSGVSIGGQTERHLKTDQTDGEIVGDPNRLRQVMFHLVGAAIDASAREGRVQVSSFSDGHEFGFRITTDSSRFGERLRSVSETVSSEVDLEKRTPELGLNVARALVSLQGGRIQVDIVGRATVATATFLLQEGASETLSEGAKKIA